MITPRSLILALVFTALSAFAETVSLTGVGFQSTSVVFTNTYVRIDNTNGYFVNAITVRAGDVATIRSVSSWSAGDSVSFFVGSTNYNMTNRHLAMTTTDAPKSFVGPGYIFISGINSLPPPTTVATVHVERAGDPALPCASVLVPAEANGPVTVLLETSTNLTTWTSALPGSYGSTSQNQFFRVRAVFPTP